MQLHGPGSALAQVRLEPTRTSMLSRAPAQRLDRARRPPMPNAIPAGATDQLPPARMIDPRGHRFGAGVLGGPADRRDRDPDTLARGARPRVDRGERGVRPAVLDLRRDLAPDRQGREAGSDRARARVPAALRPGARQRRAHACRSSRSRSGRRRSGWVFALAVAALQTLLAVTGYCLGCRLYFLRWWVPDLVDPHLDPRPGPARRVRRGADPLPTSAALADDVGPAVRPGRDDLALGLEGGRPSAWIR